MGREFGDLFSGLIGAAIIVIGLLVAAVIITPLFLIGIAGYIAFRLWHESPARAERMAYQETMRLYHHAKAGQVQLSDADIGVALGERWPGTTPAPLRIQFLELGWISMRMRD